MTRNNKALLTNRSGGLLYTAGKFIKYYRALKYILSPCIYKTLETLRFAFTSNRERENVT